MVAILEKIILEKFSSGGECNLFHHGVVQDCLEGINLDLYEGNLYGIIGEFGMGGAALSCGMTGNTNIYNGKIFINEEEKPMDYLVQRSWYVGTDLYKNKAHGIFFNKYKIKKNTIKEQIEFGINNVRKDLEFASIQRDFKLSNERINRNIEFVSGERWKASSAIGYANGKKVFCYPWFNSKDIKQFQEQLADTINTLLNLECIVMIPTTKEENIQTITNKGHMIFL